METIEKLKQEMFDECVKHEDCIRRNTALAKLNQQLFDALEVIRNYAGSKTHRIECSDILNMANNALKLR